MSHVDAIATFFHLELRLPAMIKLPVLWILLFYPLPVIQLGHPEALR